MNILSQAISPFARTLVAEAPVAAIATRALQGGLLGGIFGTVSYVNSTNGDAKQIIGNSIIATVVAAVFEAYGILPIIAVALTMTNMSKNGISPAGNAFNLGAAFVISRLAQQILGGGLAFDTVNLHFFVG